MSSPESPDVDGFVLRPADEEDSEAVAEVFLAARRAAGPAMPPPVRADDDVRAWLAGRLHAADEVWVAEAGGCAVGYLRISGDWLDDLYVTPGRTGEGIGAALLDLAKAQRPDGFALWVFASNQGARRFYRRHGLVELEHTDGSGNEEQAPDVQMAWPGRQPLSYLRARIDEVDAELARAIARRAALTAAVQHFKPVPGHAGRDTARERDIAARMHQRAPDLPVESWQRIVHDIVTASLDAAQDRRDR